MNSNRQPRLALKSLPATAKLFHLLFKQPYFDQIQPQLHNLTSSLANLPEGEWRANAMFEDSTTCSIHAALTLRHITSFEEKSMEDHGKTLKKTLENYLNFDSQFQPREVEAQEQEKKYEELNSVDQEMALVPNFEENKKIFLLNFSRSNIQAQLILRQLFKKVKSVHLPYSLSMTKEIFEYYLASGVQQMEEDQIEAFVESNFLKFGEKIKETLPNSKVTSVNPQDELIYLQMIGVWMKTIFLALNGVFQNPEDRKTPFEDLEGYETFYTARKMIKID